MQEPFEFLDDEEIEDEKTGFSWLPLILCVLAIAGFLMIPILGFLETGKSLPTPWSSAEPVADGSLYVQKEEIEVGLTSGETPDGRPQQIPDLEGFLADLSSVDETLASLGENQLPKASEPAKKESESDLSIAERSVVESEPAKDDTLEKPALPGGRPLPEKPAKDPVALKKINLVKVSPKSEIKKQPARPEAGPQEVVDLEAVERPLEPAQAATTSMTARRLPSYQKPVEQATAAEVARPTSEVTVEAGDSLYTIAAKNGATPEEIFRLNGSLFATLIKPGQKLRVPAHLARPQGKSKNPNPLR